LARDPCAGRAEGLTIYDATYLELAMRRARPLQTKDEALIAAATRRGVRDGCRLIVRNGSARDGIAAPPAALRNPPVGPA
jgi:hypothetical protein